MTIKIKLKWVFCPFLDHNDSLLHLVYEKVQVDESKLEAHLWTFRPQINLEHLKRVVQADGSQKILDAFLEVVRYLIEYTAYYCSPYLFSFNNSGYIVVSTIRASEVAQIFCEQ